MTNLKWMWWNWMAAAPSGYHFYKPRIRKCEEFWRVAIPGESHLCGSFDEALVMAEKLLRKQRER
jgi:hypothetical protein